VLKGEEEVVVKMKKRDEEREGEERGLKRVSTEKKNIKANSAN
jgi:hypothetical protein